MIHQHEIDAQIQTAMEVKMRINCQVPAVIKVTKIGRKHTLGFHFESGLTVGQKGLGFEVVAIV